jgi:hypothetical protein
MIRWFIVNQWKESVRSTIWNRNLVGNIILGFVVLMLVLDLVLVGLFIDVVLKEANPGKDPVMLFNGILLFYFGIDLLIRYLAQSLPTLSVESYLHLPIRKSVIVHYVVGKSLVHIFNVLPFLIIIPFMIKVLVPLYSGVQLFGWILSVFCLVLTSNFLATFFKRILVSKPAITAVFGLILLLLGVMDYLGWVSLSSVSAQFFGAILKSPLLAVIAVIILCLVYLLNYLFLRSRLYPEEVIQKKRQQTAGNLPYIKYLDSMGMTGDLVTLEIKLWLRHKRTKSMLYMLPLLIFYGFFFYPQPVYKDMTPMLIFVGIFMSGGMMMNYLNYAFAYESNYFDGILTRKIDMRRYLSAKLGIGMIVSAFCFIVTIPYVFFGLKILVINIVTFVFNIGCLSFLLLYLATYNKKRMDLSKGAAFNYQGIGAMNWLVMFPAFIAPILIYIPFKLAGIPYVGIAVIGLIGMAGLIFSKYIIELIFRQFHKRRYLMAEGFREG